MSGEAAVSIVRDPAGRYLCVWNQRFNGWTFPGGKLEPGELPETALARELYEETGVHASRADAVFVDYHDNALGRFLVHVFVVEEWSCDQAEPYGREVGSPVSWLTKAELLEQSPFAEFYRRVFAR